MAGSRRGYAVVVDEDAKGQLRWLLRHDRRAYNRIQEALKSRLASEPTHEDTNRKPMTGSDATTSAGYEADWELRVQPYRVYYNVDERSRRVRVIGIADKPRETATPVPQA